MILIEETPGRHSQESAVVNELRLLGFDANLQGRETKAVSGALIPVKPVDDARLTTLEQILAAVPVNFEALPVLADGESKQVRLWTDRVVLMRLKPTVYSFTWNRYGEALGTELVRLRFTAELFRRMARPKTEGGLGLEGAFLAEIETSTGPLLAQKRVDPGNLEIRIKRYHIGSPVHRYRYTERYQSMLPSGPVRQWTRFPEPVVCFDWRNPLKDEVGTRLADEPLSDDYARIWMRDVDRAKATVRHVFLWMEDWFVRAGVRLVDLCLFVDREGRIIFGEISPDCMRVQLTLDKPEVAQSADKDLWRSGKSAELLLARYQELYRRLFGDAEERP